MNVILDRYEGTRAVIELPDGQIMSAPAVIFEGAKEGDVIAIQVNLAETQLRKDWIAKQMKDIMGDS